MSKTKNMLFTEKNTKTDFRGLNIKIAEKNVERIGADCKDKFVKFVGHVVPTIKCWRKL